MKKIILIIIIFISILLISCNSPLQIDNKESLAKNLREYIENLNKIVTENPNILNEPSFYNEKIRLSDEIYEQIEKIRKIVYDNVDLKKHLKRID